MSLFRKSKQQMREQMSSRRPHIIKALEKIQDFQMELKWDFQSWGMKTFGCFFKERLEGCLFMFTKLFISSAFCVKNLAVGHL